VTIRLKLVTAVTVAITGLALTTGAGIWGMSRLSDRFDRVQQAADGRAVALQLKFAVTDFNGWQTAYGYDNGKSRPTFLASVASFRSTSKLARAQLRLPREQRLLDEMSRAFDDFMRLDARAWAALQAGRTAEVRRLFLGPEIVNFERMARAAEQLAVAENVSASREEQTFRSTRKDALRYMIGASVIAGLLVAILVATALDLARNAERVLERQPPIEE
jgi:methyl-accepting chemotaxis protein